MCSHSSFTVCTAAAIITASEGLSVFFLRIRVKPEKKGSLHLVVCSFSLPAHRLVLCFLVKRSPGAWGQRVGWSLTGFSRLAVYENLIFVSAWMLLAIRTALSLHIIATGAPTLKLNAAALGFLQLGHICIPVSSLWSCEDGDKMIFNTDCRWRKLRSFRDRGDMKLVDCRIGPNGAPNGENRGIKVQ